MVVVTFFPFLLFKGKLSSKCRVVQKGTSWQRFDVNVLALFFLFLRLNGLSLFLLLPSFCHFLLLLNPILLILLISHCYLFGGCQTIYRYILWRGGCPLFHPCPISFLFLFLFTSLLFSDTQYRHNHGPAVFSFTLRLPLGRSISKTQKDCKTVHPTHSFALSLPLLFL